jgi:prephenate dehydratase
MVKRVGYLGPPGTFTEAAAFDYAPEGLLLPYPSVAAVAAAVDLGEADEGVVAIENSLEGSVTDTLDLLIHDSTLFIRRELVLVIEHCLLARPGTQLSDIKIVYSHPQALGQCRKFLGQHLPNVQIVAALSTAAAVEELQNRSDNAAAIGNLRAAEIYQMEVLIQGIQDTTNPNLTRFIVLAHSDHPVTGEDKTSFCFTFDDDRPGLLYAVMEEFARRGINMAKVESRPTRQTLGRYIFLVDVDGHREDTRVVEALEALRTQVSMIKVFGSYPRYGVALDL